ncbi:MAG: hypothetical protein ACFCVF_09690 [Kineosporiaceae bacterium]
MTSDLDGFSAYDDILAETPWSDPWRHHAGAPPRFDPDHDILGRLLTVPVRAGSLSQSGRFAKGIDAWLAHELRRSGFGHDEIWPRAVRPRVLPRDIAVLLEQLPRALANDIRARLPGLKAVGPSDARILGRAYEKRVDVCLARWDRGPEILISTKAQISSFAKNLPNRFEEAYGDAGNLRRRYPMAAVGFFFVQRSTVLDKEPDAFERAVDMMRKLRDDGGGNGYSATGLALAEWTESPADTATVRVRLDEVPEDVRPAEFMTVMIDTVLAATPVTHHVDVRQLRQRRVIPVEESDHAG